MEINIEWQKVGNFTSIENNNDPVLSGRGVYFWLFTKGRKRIVYVGTATGRFGFSRRLKTHLDDLRAGNAYLVKPNKSFNDIYQFIRQNPYNLSVEDKYQLMETILIPPQKLSKEWKDYIESDYLRNIDIYITEIGNDPKGIIAKHLEAQLQIYFKKRERIGYYNSGNGIGSFQSWLGPGANNKNLLTYRFTVSNGIAKLWSELDSSIGNQDNIDYEFYDYLDSILKQASKDG